MMVELKNCPFCGGEATLDNIGNKKYQVYCMHCSTIQMGKFYDTEEEAIAAWNHRADGWIPVSERLPKVGMPVLVQQK